MNEIIIPKVHVHDLEIGNDGVGSLNPKEYCKCVACKALRQRRDSIFGLTPVKFKPKYSQTLLKISDGARQLFNYILR